MGSHGVLAWSSSRVQGNAVVVLAVSAMLLAVRGFVKLKKIQKSEKNSEVGAWVKPQLGFLFFLKYCVFCDIFFVVHVSKKKIIEKTPKQGL